MTCTTIVHLLEAGILVVCYKVDLQEYTLQSNKKSIPLGKLVGTVECYNLIQSD